MHVHRLDIHNIQFIYIYIPSKYIIYSLSLEIFGSTPFFTFSLKFKFPFLKLQTTATQQIHKTTNTHAIE